jgi:predicted RecA/RadA family phage recombinase
MALATYIQEGEVLDFVNGSGSDIAYKEVVVLSSGIAVAGESIANGATGSLRVCGVFEIAAIATAAFAVGDKLFWDASAGKLTNVSSGNTPAGYCVEAKASDGATAKVKLVKIASGNYVKGQRFTVSYDNFAAADVAKTFWVAPAACKVVAAQERHVTVAGQAGTLQVEKVPSGTAPGAGTVALAATFDLTSTANTVVEKAAVTTAGATLAKGDALALKVASGAATSLALATMTVEMEWL